MHGAGHPGEFHDALQPDRVIDPSENHSINMIPDGDVTAAGTADPEAPYSSTVYCAQSIVAQLFTVTLSYPYSVSKVRKVSVTSPGGLGAMMADMVSDFAWSSLPRRTKPVEHVQDCLGPLVIETPMQLTLGPAARSDMVCVHAAHTPGDVPRQPLVY